MTGTYKWKKKYNEASESMHICQVNYALKQQTLKLKFNVTKIANNLPLKDPLSNIVTFGSPEGFSLIR